MNFKHKSLWLVSVAQMLVVALNLSCGSPAAKRSDSNVVASVSQNSASNKTPNNSQTLSSQPQEKDPSSIRSLDFKNFTYPWYPSYLKAPHGSREVSLRDGKFEIAEDKQAGIDNLILELDNVSYADLTKDDKKEAIVTIAGIETFNSFLNCIFIYAVGDGKQRLLWRHQTGDRADGGLRRVAVEDHTLVIEQYTRSEGDGGLCCPRKFIRSYYSWNGRGLKKMSSKKLSNEYENARFLGYPDQSADKSPN
jgi:hypothetical protein